MKTLKPCFCFTFTFGYWVRSSIFLSIVLSLLMMGEARAQKVILTDSKARIDISLEMGVYTDTSGVLDIEEAARKKYTYQRHKLLSFPFSEYTYWLKIEFENTLYGQKEWVLEWNNSLGEHIDFYFLQPDGSYTVRKDGALADLPFNYFENIPKARFTLNPGKKTTAYIRVRSDRGFNTDVFVASPAVYTSHISIALYVQGFIAGIVFLRLFYILYISFFAVKESLFRKYSVLQVLRSFAFLGLNGLLGGLFFQNPEKANLLNYLSYQIVPLGTIVVALAILPMHRFHSIFKYIFHLLLILICISTLLIIFDYQWKWMVSGVYFFIVTQLLILSLFAYTFIRRLPVDINFTIPFLLVVFSYIFVQMRMIGLMDAAWIIPFAYVCFVSEIFVFGFFLGRIIKNYEKSRSEAQTELKFKQQINQQLTELNQVKTRFFANISHEFRTPLTLILTPLDGLVNEFPKRRILRTMKQNADRLLLLINELLDLSKLEAGQMKESKRTVDLVKFFDALFSSFEFMASSKKINFSISQSHESLIAQLDTEKMEKIFNNLVSNAIKFTSQPGKVKVTLNYQESSNQLILIVEDNGRGMETLELEKIFDQFYQVSPSETGMDSGTGIGLALVRELVFFLGGKIDVKSQPGHGTRFDVFLPLKKIEASEFQESIPERVQAYPEEEAPIPKTSQNEKRLLLVDDNTEIRQYIRSIFESEYEILEAENGLTGLTIAQDQTPDIIISDVMMPKMDGYEFTRTLKSDQRTSHIPIILLTAKASETDRLDGLKLGVDDYLVKPFGFEEIQIRVKNLLIKQEKLRLLFSKNENLQSVSLTNPLDIAFIERANEILETNYKNSRFAAADFAEALNLSQSQCLRKLKALTGFTLNDFIRNYRLQKAKDYLQTTELSISEIALEVGFENMSYFAKVFQKEFGALPSSFR